jgi:non-ribosomal peptide synthetase component F
MDFDEMTNALQRALKSTKQYPQMLPPPSSVSMATEKQRLEHILDTAPNLLFERPVLNINQFAEKTKMGIPEVAFTGWEALLTFMRDYDRMSQEVARLSRDLNRQRTDVINILQDAIDQISRGLRESVTEDLPPSE